MERRALTTGRSIWLGLALVAAMSLLPAGVMPTQAADKTDSKAAAQRIAAIESGFQVIEVAGEAPLRLTLSDWMEMLNVPGISVAVFDDFKIVWTKTYGVVEAGTGRSVTPRTLFQAGSISKPVAATATMYFVERGKLSLDEDVNRKLVSWKVPENEFTAREKVTLRRIMSHTAGLTVHGFPGYAVGERVPAVVQILNGEKPANTAPIRVDILPGTRARYSGGGTTVMQQLLVDVFDKPFPVLLKEIVLGPVGMKDSTYEQPLPRELAARAATGHRGAGEAVPGKWHIYPEMAAAGLWTTPTDLSKFAIEIARAWNGKSKLLSARTAREMLTPQMDEAMLGFFTNKENPHNFGHGGADEGFQALLTAFADTGQGAAIMTNSDNGGRLAGLLMANIAREYGWKLTPPKPALPNVLLALTLKRNVEVAISEYRRLRRERPGDSVFNEGQLNALGYTLMNRKRLDDAIRVFQLNVEMYPNAWNPADSLGEAYMQAGKNAEAIRYYEKSLQLNPNNQNAVKILEKLRSPAK